MTADRRDTHRASPRILLLGGTALFVAAGIGCAPSQAQDIDRGNSDHRFHFDPGTLVISSSIYDRHQGAVASVAVGTPLANTDTATVPAVAGNSYPTLWNNASVDGSFGVTAPIELLDINASNGQVIHGAEVPANQVVTSFSSKSELGLHVVNDWPRLRVIFIGYASPGVGALDVSNSDAMAGQDPTNPVTFAFGSSYAFARTFVSVDADGNYAYTPTIDYGGNNGRAALLGSNGLYYTVGNANNGNAATFSPSNGINPDVTETTGVEAVNPIDSMFLPATIPANNSAEIDPLLQFTINGKKDKADKDDNFRGITEFDGALYFTKGSEATVSKRSIPPRGPRSRPWRRRMARRSASCPGSRPIRPRRSSPTVRAGVISRPSWSSSPMRRRCMSPTKVRQLDRRIDACRAREMESGRRHVATRLHADQGPDRGRRCQSQRCGRTLSRRDHSRAAQSDG